MGKRILTGLLFALLIPYIVTLAWSGGVGGRERESAVSSGKRILLDRGDTVNSYMDVEEYLPGVVAMQIPADYGAEALKAQAVIARTYIYKQMEGEAAIEESALDMDYLEKRQMEELWGSDHFVSYYNEIEQAVRATRGVAITYDGEYIDPLFHRASTGYTREGDERHPYLKSAASPRDVEADDYLTVVSWSLEEFADRINAIPEAAPVTADQVPVTLQLIAKDRAGYVTQLQVGAKTYTGEEIQRALELPSSGFTLEEYEGGIRAVCRGIGHGYGLSQFGARAKAEEGWKAEDILSYFYKNIVLISE